MNEASRDFLDELKALFRKHKAELELEEDSRGWDCSTYKMTVFSYTQYDNDGNVTRDCIELDLGSFFNGE